MVLTLNNSSVQFLTIDHPNFCKTDLYQILRTNGHSNVHSYTIFMNAHYQEGNLSPTFPFNCGDVTAAVASLPPIAEWNQISIVTRNRL